MITKEELEYLSDRVRKLQELAKRICEEKIESIAQSDSPGMEE